VPAALDQAIHRARRSALGVERDVVTTDKNGANILANSSGQNAIAGSAIAVK
jgi:hypothetical protein